jgi:hypothetical protein
MLMAIARLSSAIAAMVWFFGLPIMGLAGVLPSDAEYRWMGMIWALLGLTLGPLVIAYGRPRLTSLGEIVGTVGLIVCLALMLAGILLVLGSTGFWGEKAPTWIASVAGIPLIGLFVWVLLASASTRSSTMLGRQAYRLGVLTAVSFFISCGSGLLLYVVSPGFVITNATIPFLMISFILIWLGLPSWLTALAVRLRASTPA